MFKRKAKKFTSATITDRYSHKLSKSVSQKGKCVKTWAQSILIKHLVCNKQLKIFSLAAKMQQITILMARW